MKFRIADTFVDSLAKLTDQEQKAAKTTAFDLQMNPANPGMRFHKLEKSKDPNFWSVRVNRDIRIITHKTESSLMLCYVGHHDDAYQWAGRRKLETHPKTGAAQIVELRETVREFTVPKYVPKQELGNEQKQELGNEQKQELGNEQKPPLFTDISKDDLLGYGVPAEWLDDVLKADEDTVLELADHLPGEAAEALLDLATGVTPQVAQPVPDVEPFDHPDAMRRFRVMSDVDELRRALDYPWEKWTVFLHPAQRKLVEKDQTGPARISGSAGTGKTIVALHRAVFLARANPDVRILLTTFSETLANALRTKLRRLIGDQPQIGERLEVHAMNAIGFRLFELNFGRPRIVSRDEIKALLAESAEKTDGHAFTPQFLIAEWEEIVDAWQLETWEAYRDVRRLGRKTRLPEKRRCMLWTIFEDIRSELKSRGLTTNSELFHQLAKLFSDGKRPPFDHVVVDEAQDVGVAQLRFLAAFGAGRPDALFFAGDLGQRIFQQPFSWKALGVDIRGRSRTLRINYRTSHQIRKQADRLLAHELSDVDGNTEERGAISVFNGPKPDILVSDTTEIEIEAVGKWLSERISEGMAPHEIGVFVRSDAELDRGRTAVESAELSVKVLDENASTASGHVSVGAMHLAKGLEFRAVAVMACDDEVIPLQARIETVADDTDLEEVYNTERHLLYVACTRARDRLLVSGVGPASEFLDDMLM